MILTKRQKQIYDFVEEHIDREGYAPTLEEIGIAFDLSSLATVHKHVSNLIGKGLLKRKLNHSRAIELVRQHPTTEAIELPLLGTVAAGRPIEVIEGNESFVVPKDFVRRQQTFILRVEGDSMIDDGIHSGDFLVVEERSIAENGETVVAYINGAATVKRFRRKGRKTVALIPANQAMPAIIYGASEVEIRGIVVGVMRKY